MCVDSLWRTNTKNNYVALFCCPYENQVRLIFTRINELIDDSPAILKNLKSRTKNPFVIEFKNHSRIVGFTTGASSGSGAASVRGQRADYLYLDESDYMSDADFDSILMLAGERSDIGVFLSSTPTGARKRFWQCCTDPSMHFKEFHFPSMCNPNWGPQMEEEFRAQLSEAGYTHEVLAEFGEQETGVFNKDRIDAAMEKVYYKYNPLTTSQKRMVENDIQEGKYKELIDLEVPMDYEGVFKPNVFRTIGVDWDKYGASSSIIILDFDVIRRKFMVIKSIEVPKVEYSFDYAVKLIIRLNEIYNPSFIYVDRGSGEFQLETLHLYGEENPESGLKNKVKGWQFSQTIDVTDPVKKTIVKEPMKPFMVNQLTMAFERNQMILCPFDETVHKQLIDYEVVKIGANGRPIFTDENEHFVDALGLAFLAFALEFPDITKTYKKVEYETALEVLENNPINNRVNKMLNTVGNSFNSFNPWKQNLKNGSFTPEMAKDPNERDVPKYFKVNIPSGIYGIDRGNNSSVGTLRNGWGSRAGLDRGSFNRKSW